MSGSFRFRKSWLVDAGAEDTWRAALGLASACKIAYHPGAQAEAIVRNDWHMNAQAFEVNSTQGIVLENSDLTVVAFRGTDSVSDWLGNLSVTPKSVPRLGGSVHRGFYNAYRDVEHIVDAAVSRAEGRALWFTGHSLGGALALIAAMMHRDRDISGIITFGQPRTLGRRPSKKVLTRFGEKYRRFINRDDIVPKVPPGYSHSGLRTHFTVSGAHVHTFGVEAEDGDTDVSTTFDDVDAELSIEEFVELQETIDAIAEEISAAPNGDVPDGLDVEDFETNPNELLDASVEGLVPGVSDHRIDNYVAEVNSRASAEISVQGMHETFAARRSVVFRQAATQVTEEPLSPFGDVERNFDLDEEEAFFGSAGSESQDATYLLRLDDGHGWVPPPGVKMRSLVGSIASISATKEGVEALSGDRNVLTIEVSREAGIEELNQSVPHVKATQVHNRSDVPERGGHALVGIIDTGIDILHEAFNDDDGNSRVLAVWLQWDQTGPSPHAVDPDAFSQDYGTLYVASDIQTIREQVKANAAAPVPRGLRDEFSGHGTHVASIAAGRRFADVGHGMAPEAGIVVVAAHNSKDPDNPDEPRSIGYSAAHVDALDFLKKVARGRSNISDEPRPMAINVSLGMNAGAHDGQTTLESAFDGITDNGRDPGLVVVKSAGNERGHHGHSSVQAAEGALVDVTWNTPSNNRNLDYLEAWFEPGDDIEFTLNLPDDAIVGPVNFDTVEASHETAGYSCHMALAEGHSDNGHNRLAISVEKKFGGSIPSGSWRLDLFARRIVSLTAMVHIWAERVRDRSVKFTLPNPQMTLSVPGTARSVVTVGASNSSFPMRLLPASSLGLTRDGRPKPEICAPGERIVAAKANDASDAKTAKDGTSMAAPHVTGAIALVFSAGQAAGLPRLPNAKQIQQQLKLTAQNFSHVHNPGFGSGMLDAEAFFDKMT